MRWTEHYLDVVPQDLSSKLTKPGNFIITPLNGSHYRVHYRVGFEDNKIRYVDIDISEWQGTDDELCEHLASGLKTVVGLDFDLTLTKEHTAPEVNPNRAYSDAENYRFPSQFDVIDALGSKPSVHLAITTRQYQNIVQGHLDTWYSKRTTPWQTSIDAICANQEALDLQGKDAYIRQVSYELMAKQEFIGLRTLKLSTVPFVIDVVEAYLVDDDSDEIKACERVGIKTVEVDRASNSFLRRLVQIFHLDLKLAPQFLPRQVKPNPLLEERPRPVQRANSKRQLSFLDSEEVKDENPSPTKELREDLEALELRDGVSVLN